jgi:carboxymethylenebutenolidase
MPSFWEKVQVAGADMDLYASVPSGSGPFPAVVIAHPASGVGEFTQSIADRLATEGFAAVAPDLFHRVTEAMLADGSARTAFLNDAHIVADINATVDFLRNHPAIDGEKLGVTGFCMGGRITWLAAATNPHFKAAVPFYGGNLMVARGDATQSPFELTNGINCPMLFHFGGIDGNPSPEDMQTLDAELARLGKEHQFHTYPGADHAFMDFSQPTRFHQQAAEAAWPRTVAFFAGHLKEATAVT